MPVKALYFLGDVVSCWRFVIRGLAGKDSQRKDRQAKFRGTFLQKFSNEHEAIMDALATRSTARALLTKFMDRMGEVVAAFIPVVAGCSHRRSDLKGKTWE